MQALVGRRIVHDDTEMVSQSFANVFGRRPDFRAPDGADLRGRADVVDARLVRIGQQRIKWTACRDVKLRITKRLPEQTLTACGAVVVKGREILVEIASYNEWNAGEIVLQSPPVNGLKSEGSFECGEPTLLPSRIGQPR
jgi:hypothetical protein